MLYLAVIVLVVIYTAFNGVVSCQQHTEAFYDELYKIKLMYP